jgi:hypothetical protein
MNGVVLGNGSSYFREHKSAVGGMHHGAPTHPDFANSFLVKIVYTVAATSKLRNFIGCRLSHS